jgi:hypothetical protein
MKLFYVALLLLFVSCNNNDTKDKLSMTGAYTMLSQNVKNEKIDTTYTSLQQLKIYTDDYMMYANINTPDSISSFGLGSYSVNMDTVIENVIYNASDSIRDDTARSYNLVIEKTGKGYKQVIPEIGTGENKIKLTEEYSNSGSTVNSPLDGAWKLVKRLVINGKDTTVASGVQFKTYNAGYCIWGHTWADSLNKVHTGIGFGKFEMNGSNKVKESMLASTYADVRGHDFDITIEMNGTDGFTQTMDNGSGGKSVEVYQRLKK